MRPEGQDSHLALLGFPRVSGDAPEGRGARGYALGFSPRERGCAPS